MVDVEFSPYELKSKIGNNRKGALLKVIFNSGGIGYADCHVWPELGDPSLEEMMGHIRFKRNDHPHFKNMIINAYIDLCSRRDKRLVGYENHIIKNHYLFPSVENLSHQFLEKLKDEGYSHIKLKVGRDIDREAEKIIKSFSSCSSFKIRLDFNARVNKHEYINFLTSLTKKKLPIEFCEDPFPYDIDEWTQVQKETGIPIAADRYANKIFQEKEFPFIIIIKPAVDNITEIANRIKKQKFVVTSYLDHPIGQVAAAFHAQNLDLRFPKNGMCHGLLSHHVYEPTDYSKQLSQKGPYFVFPKGYGFGYGEQLRKESWIP
ncbi:MAG: enolase C-terminal domain-like protein [Chlamydiota bacterium]